MALFDAVGKALEVPCHRLLGTQLRERVFLSWWVIDMPAEDWLAEAKDALEAGYTNFKTKTRPWFDVEEQCETLSREMPEWFELDLDFNESILDTAHGLRVLHKLERFRRIAVFESPILQKDVEGNRYLKSMVQVPLAMHYGNPPIMTALREDVCDGFVLRAGASNLMQQGHIISAANKVFWLQLVGTAIAAAWGLHFAAVLSHARWPAVNCHQLFSSQVVKPEIRVTDGMAFVPQTPGLGVELDEDAVERYKIEPKAKPYPTKGLLIAIRWPSGSTSYYAHALQYWDDFMAGRLPIFAPGVRLEQVPDDGSREWRELQQRVQEGGVHTS
jgi:L-alanine-DL-glutamate epimerase-like enolase superfamily enzyme